MRQELQVRPEPSGRQGLQELQVRQGQQEPRRPSSQPCRMDTSAVGLHQGSEASFRIQDKLMVPLLMHLMV